MTHNPEWVLGQSKIGSITVGELMAAFLEVKGQENKVTTVYTIRRYLRLHFLDVINPDRLVTSLTIKDFQKLRKSLIDSNMNQQNRVIAWVKEMFVFCNNYFNFRVDGAFRLCKIKKSYSDLTYKKKQIYTYDQFKKFIKGVEDPLKLALFYCLYFLGLRVGEIRGLEWRDIINGRLYVNRTATSKLGNRKTNLLDPKSVNSVRSFKLPRFILDLLLKVKETSPGKFIFSVNENNPIGETSIQRYLLQQAKTAGLPYLHPHGWRHSCACYLVNVQNESLLNVSKWLGHRSVEITASVYVDLFPGEKEAISDRIEENIKKI